MRYFETRAPLPLTAEGFIELRNDVGFDHFCAEWENQILEIELHETEDGSMHRVMSKKMKENPVPALLRGLAPAEIEFVTEERFDPSRCSVSSPMVITAKLPGSLAEMVSIDSLQWIERSTDGTNCVLCSQHEVTARVRGFGSTIEKKLEDKIRASYENIPKQVAAYLVKHGVPSAPSCGSRRSVSERSARHSIEGYRDKVVAVDVRRRVSVIVDDADGRAQRGKSRCLADGGVHRRISLTTTAGRSVRSQSTFEMVAEPNSTVVSELHGASLSDSPPAAAPAATALQRCLARPLQQIFVRCLPPPPPPPPLPQSLPTLPELSLPALPSTRMSRVCMGALSPRPTITVRVADFCEVDGHTRYRLVTQATTAEGTFHVSAHHRYSDFRRLHTALRNELVMPHAFPIPKRIIHTQRVKQARQHALQEYLKGCTTRAIDSFAAPSRALVHLYRFVDLPISPQLAAIAHDP